MRVCSYIYIVYSDPKKNYYHFQTGFQNASVEQGFGFVNNLYKYTYLVRSE